MSGRGEPARDGERLASFRGAGVASAVTGTSAWQDVGDAADLTRHGRLVARVGGREIGVLRLPDGTLAAIRNRCPHSGAPLCLGIVRQRLVGTTGRYAVSGQTVLSCPWHGWEFDPVTGRCPDEPALRVATYPVRLEAGRVLVDLAGRGSCERAEDVSTVRPARARSHPERPSGSERA